MTDIFGAVGDIAERERLRDFDARCADRLRTANDQCSGEFLEAYNCALAGLARELMGRYYPSPTPQQIEQAVARNQIPTNVRQALHARLESARCGPPAKTLKPILFTLRVVAVGSPVT
jgi:hypothetical protein